MATIRLQINFKQVCYWNTLQLLKHASCCMVQVSLLQRYRKVLIKHMRADLVLKCISSETEWTPIKQAAHCVKFVGGTLTQSNHRHKSDSILVKSRIG